MTHPSPPPGPHTGMIPVVPPAPRPRSATGFIVILSLVGALLLTVIVGVIWFGTTDGPQGQKGAWNGPVPFPEALSDATSHAATFTDDTVYFRSVAEDKKVFVTAVDRKTGLAKWSLDSGLEFDNESSQAVVIEPGREAILVKDILSTSDDAYLIEADTGEVHDLSGSGDGSRYYRMVGGVAVRTGSSSGLEVLDADGGKKWGIEGSRATFDNLVAVLDSDDLGTGSRIANTADADELLSIDYDGTITVYEAETGKVVTEAAEAVAVGSTALLAYDGVLYARSSDDGRETITGYDMDDDFAELDGWEGEKEQRITGLEPCAANRLCVNGYWADSARRPVATVIDPDEGVVWSAPEDIVSTYAYIGFVGDIMAVAYYGDSADARTQTRLYDADFEQLGDPIPGLYLVADEEAFATVSQSDSYGSEPKVYDAEVSVVDGKDGRVSVLDSYPVYPGCAIDAKLLACATENGYRLWTYR